MTTAATITGGTHQGGASLPGAIGALRNAGPGLPASPRVLVLGHAASAIADAVRTFAGSVEVIAADRLDLSRPWKLRAADADVVIAGGLLNGPCDPLAWLDRLRQIAPRIWADVRAAKPSGVPLGLELDVPYALGAPPRAEAIDRFERLGLHARVADAQPSGEAEVLHIAAERMDGARPGSPLLVHVHVPKNGGMTVTGLLDKSFGADHVHLYLEDPRDEQFPHRVRARLHEYPNARAVSSHSIRSYPPVVDGRAMLYFAMLRDPAERYLSYMRYCQKNFDTLSAEHKRQLPENFLEMGVVDYIRWQAGRLEQGSGISANLQCQYFARPTTLRIAQLVLRPFFFVGLTDEMELSIRVLRAKAAMHGIELADIAVTRENTTDDLKTKTLREAEDPAVKEFLSQLKQDRELLVWAKRRLVAEAEQLGLA